MEVTSTEKKKNILHCSNAHAVKSYIIDTKKSDKGSGESNDLSSAPPDPVCQSEPPPSVKDDMPEAIF